MSQIINNRVNFATVKNPMPYPDFLDVQLKSFRDLQGFRREFPYC